MKRGIWQLTVRGEFSAAHALRHYQGKCEALHGHNYHVEMTVEGGVLSQDVELLVDFSLLKKMLKKVLEGLDHCIINETPPFDRINPSAENLSRHIYHLLESEMMESLPCTPDLLRIYSVSVSEKSAQTATYREV